MNFQSCKIWRFFVPPPSNWKNGLEFPVTSSKDNNSCESKEISGLDSRLCDKEASLCLIDVLCTAAAKQQTPKTELASIKFRFLVMIAQNALEDERDGSTLCFAGEPIGNHRSIRRSARFTLEERIFAGCSPLFPGKKSRHCQGWWQTILGRVPSQQFKQTTLNTERSTARRRLCRKEQEEWWDFEVKVILKGYEIALLVSRIVKSL